MKYKVLKTFADLQDNNHICHEGDEYPRKGYSPSDKRVKELLSGTNRLHQPLIQEVSEPEPIYVPKLVAKEPEPVAEEVAPVVQTVVEEQQKEQQEELEEKAETPKRKRSKKNDA